MLFSECKNSYPKGDLENLSVFMIYIITASKISSFLFVRKRDSPYKSISLLTLLQKTQNRLKQILHYLYDQNDTEKNDGSA